MAYKLSKRYRRFLISTLLISSIAFASYLLGWSSFLTVKEVQISGTESTSVILSELKSKNVEPVVGEKLARVEIRSVKRVLSDLDWIASAEASRNWLAKKIEIQVLERVAVAKALIAGPHQQDLFYYLLLLKLMAVTLAPSIGQ